MDYFENNIAILGDIVVNMDEIVQIAKGVNYQRNNDIYSISYFLRGINQEMIIYYNDYKERANTFDTIVNYIKGSDKYGK